MSRMLNEPLGPDARFEVHLELSEKYLGDAEELLARGDYVQASGKAWDAAAQMVKAVVAKEGRSSGVTLSCGGIALYQNFYEGWMPPREVELAVRDVKVFIEKLRAIARL